MEGGPPGNKAAVGARSNKSQSPDWMLTSSREATRWASIVVRKSTNQSSHPSRPALHRPAALQQYWLAVVAAGGWSLPSVVRRASCAYRHEAERERFVRAHSGRLVTLNDESTRI